MDDNSLKEIILKLYKSRSILIDINRYIMNNFSPLSIKEHAKQVLKFYDL